MKVDFFDNHLKEDSIVASMCTNEQTMDAHFFSSIEIDRAAHKPVPKRSAIYKMMLVVHDIAAVLASFLFGAWFVNANLGSANNLLQFKVLALTALVVFCFLQSSGIYSYHRIFVTKTHLKYLLEAFGAVISTIAIGFLIFWRPEIFSGIGLVATTCAFAGAIMLMSRYWSEHMLGVLKVLGISFALVGVITLINPEGNPIENVQPLLVPICLAVTLAVVVISRLVLVNFVFNVLLRKLFRRRVAMIGADQEAKNITDHIINMKAPYWVAGVLADKNLDSIVTKKSIGRLYNFIDVVRSHKIEEIVLTDSSIGKNELISLLDVATTMGLTVWLPPSLMPIINAKIYNDDFCGLPMIRLCSQKNMWLFDKIKHSLDAVITLIGFTLLFPLFATISLAVKFTSEGTVFYRAEVIGKAARRFKMFKFRSMYTAAKSDIHKDYVTKLIKGEIKSDENDKKPLKITDDPRVTPVGRIIRKLSLDELPQLINVLKGDMSLVGPRPCLPYEWELYEDWQKKRTIVRPGITGLWQVAGRSEVSFEDMMLLDFYYIYNRSLMLDMNILYETVFVVLGKKGAY